MSLELTVYTDGACSGNPGPAGVGGVFYDGDKEIASFSEAIGDATNNIAEYSALIYALRKAKELKAVSLKILTDSKLMQQQLIGQYKVKNDQLKMLFEEAQKLARQFENVSIQYVPREQNKEADALATGAIKKKKSGQMKVVASAFKNVGEESPSSKG